MNVIFMGTPKFAVKSLEMLVENHNVCVVVSQPDRPKGRGKKMIETPVKEAAQAHNIAVLQPEKVREVEFVEKLKEFNPDIIIVVAFGQILPESILNIPKYGCINVHGSLLPLYRGAAPMQWSVINGDTQTGITTMYMAKGLDSGDMLIKSIVDITPEDTYGTVHDKMAVVGAETLKTTLELIEKGEAVRIPQNHDEATFAPMINKETGHIDWNKNSSDIINLIRGMNPQPGAYSICDDEVVKIWLAEKNNTEYNGKHGEIVEISKKHFTVKTFDGAINILEIQSKGGKKMSADAYMRGHEIEKGMILN